MFVSEAAYVLCGGTQMLSKEVWQKVSERHEAKESSGYIPSLEGITDKIWIVVQNKEGVCRCLPSARDF
jgi:hypothetical protein